MTTAALNLETDFVVITPAMQAKTIAVTPTIYAQLDAEFNQFNDHQLVSIYSFDRDWPSWEIHPHGDEVVVLISGHCTMLLETADGIVSTTLSASGDFVVVSKNTWHTAHTATPTKMLFITPGEGTQNRDC